MDMDNALELLWLVPALPLAGAALLGILGSRLNKAAINTIGVGSAAASFMVALAAASAFLHLAPEQIPFTPHYFTWLSLGNLNIDAALHLDQLSLVMMLVVTGVGSLIHLYSVGYMAGERGYSRFFVSINLFLFFMLVLVLAGNYVLMFVGWEGVGLCSYLLIGFYYEKKAASDAGKKAFIVNRIGDFGFLLGIFFLFRQFGTLDFVSLFPRIDALPIEVGQFPAGILGFGVLTSAALLLFVGAAGKSAQVPLYVWLPDAMEGPTPVSALIHAATMVTAGIYMVARSHVLFAHAPFAMTVIAFVGAFTALFAATIGLVQTDIKRVLAYSTVSQLGYMFLALGVGAWSAAIFHLVTHAFFKALLFLGAGSVIHAMSGEQDMNHMGGLRKRIPLTYWTFLLATLAIVGAPGFSGFFSKDEILWKTYAGDHTLLYAMGAVAAAMTSFYMFRLVFKTFHGAERFDSEVAGHVHESPATMTFPLVALAALSVVGGWVGIPAVLGGANLFEHFLAPVFGAEYNLTGTDAHSTELIFMGAAVAIALAGFLLAVYFYLVRPNLTTALKQRAAMPHRILLNKYYVDELYAAVIVRPLHWVSDKMLWRVFDVELVDGLVNGAATLAHRLGKWARAPQSGNTRSYASWVVTGALLVMLIFALRLVR